MTQIFLPQFDLQLKVLAFFGFWQPENSTRALKIRCVVFHSVFILVTLVFPLINFFYYGENLENVSVHIALYVGPNLKIPILMFRMKNFVQLFEEMRSLIEFTKSKENRDRINLRKHVKLMEKVTIIILVIILGINMVELMNAMRNHSVPYKSWLPHKIQFVIDFAYPLSIVQVLLITFTETFTTIIEILPVSFIGMTSVLLAELSERMERFSDRKTDEESDYKELKACVQIHHEISAFVKKIQAQFSTMLFIQGFLSSAYLCSFVLDLSRVGSCIFPNRDFNLFL
jgi:hypothetical protein